MSSNEPINEKKIEKIIVNTTYKCNNHCIMCAIGDRRNLNGDFKYQALQIKKYADKGVKLIDFDGGEPSLCPHLFKLINIAKKSGYKKIHITSNARLFSNKEYCKKIIKSGVNSLSFSLHGHNAEIHEQITRSPGSFEQTLKGIYNIGLLNKNFYELDFSINITITSLNIRYIEQIINLLDENEIKIINLQLVTPFGNAKKEHYPSIGDIQKSLKPVLKKYKEKFHINLINFLPCMFESEEYFKQYLCDFDKKKRIMIFINEKEKNLKQYLSMKKEKEKNCKKCKYSKDCSGFWHFQE